MDLLSGLNSQQRQAVMAPPGPALIIAGPGSGKTRVLAHRIAYLVGSLGVPPHKIMAVTFTNKAAREMKTRVEALLEASGGLRGLTIGTFHSICARFLRREAQHLPVTSDFVIFDEADQVALMKQVIKDLNLSEKQFSPSRLLGRISAAKNELIGPEEFAAGTYFAEVARRAYARYQQLLTLNNALDFDDLLMSVVQLFGDHPEVLARYQRFYDHILVDEFQDTNTAQYALLRQLARVHRNLYSVADPDQAIYRWRGADYRNVRRFQEDYPDAQIMLLEENYRSTQLILDAAMAVIDQHPGRAHKQLFTRRDGGLQIMAYEAYNEQEEAQFVVDTIAELVARGEHVSGDFAVMYRTNAQSRAVEEAFLRAGLPYRLVGAQRFYGRKEIKDLLAYLRVIHNPADTVSLMRIVNTPPRGLGAKTIEQLQEVARAAETTPAGILADLADKGSKSPFHTVFGARAAAALAAFGQMLHHWRLARTELSVVQLMDLVIDRTDYKHFVDDDTEEGSDRWANVMELRGVAAEHEEADLAGFLQEVALVSDQDTIAEEGKAPTLLTLHAAKGLEFPVVFIAGLDEGLLPHQRSYDDPEAMHEERRLMYVGMTRAKDRLYLLRAFRRSIYGDSGLSEPSRFLDDIPDRLLTGNLARKQTTAERYFKKATRWDSEPRSSSRLVARHKTGQRVRHKMFGEGIVIEVKLTGGEEEVIVAFEDVGMKRLAASVANLEVVEG